MTKRKSLIALFAFGLVLCLTLLCGITLFGGTLTARAEDSTSSDSEIQTYDVYSYWGTIQADGQSSTRTGGALANLDVSEGTVVTIIAEDRSDAVFVKWTVSAVVDVAFADESSATTTFVMPKGDVWLDCEYKLIRSVTVENGTLEGGATSGNCTEGDRVKITAVAAPEGKEFDKWVVVSGEVTLANVNSATTTFVMPSGAVEIKATYKDIVAPAPKHNVTIENGTNNGGEEIEVGQTVTITAGAAPAGKVFDKWVVESGSVILADENSETTTFLMPNGEVKIKAIYKDITPSGEEGTPTVTEKKGLDGGAIAGIVVGSVAVVGIGGFVIFKFAVKKKSAKRKSSTKGMSKRK